MIDDILFDKRSVILRLMKVKKSPARDKLTSILKSSNEDTIIATVNAWCRQYYCIDYDLVSCSISIPDQLAPEINDPDEFFQWVTNSLKKSI